MYIGLITSADGYHWQKAQQSTAAKKEICFDDGSTLIPQRMERPFVLTDERGQPGLLFVAVYRGRDSFNVALPLVGHP
jgi:hypothetical protein